MTLIRNQNSDAKVHRAALARMSQIMADMQAEGADVAALQAEYAKLDGSWITIREIEIPDADMAAHDRILIDEANDAIKAQMREADIAIIRAITEGDTARIKAHLASQAALRAKLK